MKRCSVVLSVLLLLVNSVLAQRKDKVSPLYSKDTVSKKWAWTVEEWSGENAPYTKIRQNIDKAVANGQHPDALMARCQKAAQEKPDDPQLQFAWAYAAWQARKTVDKYDDQLKRLRGPHKALSKIASPQNYEYARVRFLLEAWFSASPELKNLGKRLVNHTFDDYDVKYYLINMLRSSSPEEWRTSLNYAEDLIRLEPQRPSAYSALGGVYFASWMKTKDRRIGEAAIIAYRKYLSLASLDAEWRSQAERIVNRIQQEQAKPQ